MNRSNYYEYCEERLITLAWRIETHGKSNLLHLNLHSENFYLELFNALYGYALINMNAVKHNAAGIDLVDAINKLVLQVSATASKQKIESALTKDLSSYSGHQFKFILIAKDAAALRKLTYANPHKLLFLPESDIYDVKSITKDIMHLQIAQQKAIYELIKAELGEEHDNVAEVSTLAEVIGLLAQTDLSSHAEALAAIPFNVDSKIVFNNLTAARNVIEDYKIYQFKIASIYAEFDKAGRNKSMSVLQALRSDYHRLNEKYHNDELFFQIVDAAISRVKKSKNYVQTTREELEMCVNMIVVDAFIRCKIFEHPSLAIT